MPMHKNMPDQDDLLDASITGRGGASFSLVNRLKRTLFCLTWTVLARWTPPPLHRWRCAVLRAFGAQIGKRVKIYGDTRIWLPERLYISDDVIVGRYVNLYNQGAISIGARAVVSQGAHICASTHAVNDRNFQLLLRPVRIEEDAWIAAEAFVGPGVTVGEGAVLSARGVTFHSLEPWTIYRGNPAVALKKRSFDTLT